MKMHPGFVGIDLSKHHLDVFDGRIGAAHRVDNAAPAIERLVAGWAGSEVFALCEASGDYDRMLHQALAAAGIDFARVNPARARDLARAAGFLAKTYALDAQMLQPWRNACVPALTPHRFRSRTARAAAQTSKPTRRLPRTGADPDRRGLRSDRQYRRHIAWLDAALADI